MDSLIPVAFGLFFLTLWCFGSIFFAKVGGWTALSSKYRATDRPTGKTLYLQSGAIGSVRYGSCLTLRVSEGGLYLAVLPPFRLAHPPLFIPWGEFHNIREKRVLFGRIVTMDVGMPVVATLILPLRVLEHRPKSDPA